MFDYSSRTLPAGAKIVIGYHDVQTGDIFGVPSKIVMSLASLLGVVQVISGLLMCGRGNHIGRQSGVLWQTDHRTALLEF